MTCSSLYHPPLTASSPSHRLRQPVWERQSHTHPNTSCQLHSYTQSSPSYPSNQYHTDKHPPALRNNHEEEGNMLPVPEKHAPCQHEYPMGCLSTCLSLWLSVRLHHFPQCINVSSHLHLCLANRPQTVHQLHTITTSYCDKKGGFFLMDRILTVLQISCCIYLFCEWSHLFDNVPRPRRMAMNVEKALIQSCSFSWGVFRQ